MTGSLIQNINFGNTLPGTIQVEKQTDPADPAAEAAQTQFGFTADLPGAANDTFALDDDDVKSVGGIAPGPYVVTETDPTADYDLTGLTCNDGQSTTPSTVDVGTRSATIKVDPGETVRCVFTNTRKTGKLTVEKQLVPDTDPGLFDLKIGTEVVVADASDGDSDSRVLPTGDYDVSELAGTGTSLTKYDSKVECDNGQSNDPGTSLDDVHVTKDSDITCVFTNTRRKGSITVVKDLVPVHGCGSL